MAVLNTTIIESGAKDPEGWWKWWNDYNEIYTSATKPMVQSYMASESVVTGRPDKVVYLRPVASRGSSSGEKEEKDCLVAGTPVWTERGPRAVDKLKVGDLVLSQNVATGELAYKPVLKTTVRPVSKLVRFSAGGSEFQCSGGHRFWLAGSGWCKSRSLKSAGRLYGVGSAQAIESISGGDLLPTYNVIVADFHTYFVGNGKLLSHNNTIPEPAAGPLPGMPRK